MNRINDFFKKEILSKNLFCEKHGNYKSMNFFADIWSKCEWCEKDREIEEISKKEIELMVKKEEFLRKSLGVAMIPKRYIDKGFDTYKAINFNQEKALGFCKEYVENFLSISKIGTSALFLGNPGTGKTHLAAAIASEVIKRYNKTALFVTTQKAIRLVKDTWRNGSNSTESEVLKSFVVPDLLVLDEVGVQYGTDSERNILFDIFNDRYEMRKPVIVISNLNLNDVEYCLGNRVIDRLREDGGRVVHFDWESKRKSEE